MSKLFEVPANERELKFKLETYKGNRIALKLIKLLKRDGVYKIAQLENINENRIFEVSIKSNQSKFDVLNELKNEIISYIPDNFTNNYLFNFKDKSLGFVYSFTVELDGETRFEVYHKIKEVRTNGGTNIPAAKNQIII